MSLSVLMVNRTRYRNLLEKELGKGKHFLEDDIEGGEIKIIKKNLNNCVNKINDFQQKLEDTGIKMSIVVDGQEGEDEILELIKDDWDYISTVMNCRDELINLKSSLQEQGSPKGNSSSVTVTDYRFDQMLQLITQMQQVLIGQQQLQHQQITMVHSNNGQVAVELEDKYWDTPAEVTFPLPNFTSNKLGGYLKLGRGPRLGGNLSLGGSPRPGRDQSPGRGPRLDGDLSLGGGPRPGRDQSLGRGPRLDGDQTLGRGPRLGGNLSLRGDLRLGRDQSPGRGSRLSGDLSLGAGSRPGVAAYFVVN